MRRKCKSIVILINNNILIIGILYEKELQVRGIENLFSKIKAENSPNLGKYGHPGTRSM